MTGHTPSSSDLFQLVGAHTVPQASISGQTIWKTRLRGKPITGLCVFIGIVLCCLLAGTLANHDPTELDLANVNQAPCREFLFGTDSLGRDIYSIIWYGCRTSLLTGLLSTSIITILGISYGCVSGMASGTIDSVMMRVIEIAQSVPVLLTQLLLTAIMGQQNILSLSCVIGVTGWFTLARVVRSEVRQIRNSEYILAARCMGASFPRIMRRHLIPNFVSAVMFIVVSSISTSMAMEATLSFLGLGLPIEEVSLGSMLALADKALLLNTWWVIVFPGLFLLIILLSVTSLGQAFRQFQNRGPSNL